MLNQIVCSGTANDKNIIKYQYCRLRIYYMKRRKKKKEKINIFKVVLKYVKLKYSSYITKSLGKP